MTRLTLDLATELAKLPMNSIAREYPYHQTHVLNGPEDAGVPRDFHPAFYGCFDWHSAVHGHWSLIKLIRAFPLAKEADIRAQLNRHLTPENMLKEAAYFQAPNRGSFERMYGWAWLLALGGELHTWDDADGRIWRSAILPLEETIVRLTKGFLPKQTYPIRIGTLASTAFALTLIHGYAATVGDDELRSLIETKAREYYQGDQSYPGHLEPSGADFLSPSLMEAALMTRVLPADEFKTWFAAFLPRVPQCLLHPPHVSDRNDGQIGHLDGLSLSRAWCMRVIANQAPSPARETLLESAEAHLEATLPHLSGSAYVGEHWLATFAILAVAC
jgi:hypothetical protein